MNKENLANALVVSASGTTIELETGHGSRLPATPFFATAAPMGEVPSKDNSEIVQVTNVSGDTLTVVRAQRGTSAKSISTGWVIGNGVYIEDMKPIPVTVATAAATAAKVGSTAEANYTPVTGDTIEVTFTNGSSVPNPTLNIDGSGAKNIRLGRTNATTATMGLGTGAGSNIKIRMWYDGTYWQLYGANANTNTTYSEIPSAEITAGTASTARTISGRRAQEIVNKAQTGVVKSTTSGTLTASSTAPASPAVGDVWIDTNDLPEELAPTSIAWKETPGGAVNGTNTSFTTASPYVGGSLQVFVNGLAQDGFVSESGPGSGTFTLDVAPLTGDNLSAQYQVRTVATGNADTVDGFHANATPTPNNIPVLDGNGKMPTSTIDFATFPQVYDQVITNVGKTYTATVKGVYMAWGVSSSTTGSPTVTVTMNGTIKAKSAAASAGGNWMSSTAIGVGIVDVGQTIVVAQADASVTDNRSSVGMCLIQRLA